jgi:lipoate-protein ligase A
LLLLDLTLKTPAENLALEEVLLEDLHQRGGTPILRFWESPQYFVVLGLGCSLADDVYQENCAADGVPILRRASGGGTVLQGPGCLSYALLLPNDLDPQLAGIHGTNAFVLERIAAALRPWQPHVAYRGISDLAIDGLKISGNAQRRKRNALLFHGTLLYGMQAEVIARYLRQPKRQPEYRENRPHEAFLRTLDTPVETLKRAVADAWGAVEPLTDLPLDRLDAAVDEVMGRSQKS